LCPWHCVQDLESSKLLEKVPLANTTHPPNQSRQGKKPHKSPRVECSKTQSNNASIGMTTQQVKDMTSVLHDTGGGRALDAGFQFNNVTFTCLANSYGFHGRLHPYGGR
jgi:hypothetical protein